MRLTAPELAERALAARAQYADCVLCGHRCEVDRTHGPAGFCQEGDGVFVAGAGVHFGEEQALVGPGWNGRARPPGVRAGSGLVLMGGCNLACRSCETAEFSLERKGVVAASPEQLAGVFLELQEKGARNLNLVTPTHVLPALLEALARAASRGFALPVVWNCGGYETREAVELLDGVVDVYLPDAKVGDDAQGEKLLGCRG
ncbi:MAG: radical SAM protein, partial [Deltaproteobacteria bacterium]|nr:radical SAM protein [Deltaproteobacteria bacterium]